MVAPAKPWLRMKEGPANRSRHARGKAVQYLSANAAEMPAEAISLKRGCAGVVALSPTGDFGNVKVIRKFGGVPDDLSAL